MKKLLLMLVAVFAMVACGGGNKKSDKSADSAKESTATVAETESVAAKIAPADFLDKMYSQLDDDTPDAFIETLKESDEFYEALSESEQEAWGKATEEWVKNNPEKMESIMEVMEFLASEGLIE